MALRGGVSNSRYRVAALRDLKAPHDWLLLVAVVQESMLSKNSACSASSRSTRGISWLSPPISSSEPHLRRPHGDRPSMRPGRRRSCRHSQRALAGRLYRRRPLAGRTSRRASTPSTRRSSCRSGRCPAAAASPCRDCSRPTAPHRPRGRCPRGRRAGERLVIVGAGGNPETTFKPQYRFVGRVGAAGRSVEKS